MRATNSVYSRRRKKRLLKACKGYFGDRKNHYRNAKNARMKAMYYAYHHRLIKKRSFRRLWIVRINVAARLYAGLSYSMFIHGMKKASIDLDRKVLAFLAVEDPDAFKTIALRAKAALVA
ncbi:MAG: 50S ribosomal protein L20 [Chlamydiia bacterium]